MSHQSWRIKTQQQITNYRSDMLHLTSFNTGTPCPKIMATNSALWARWQCTQMQRWGLELTSQNWQTLKGSVTNHPKKSEILLLASRLVKHSVKRSENSRNSSHHLLSIAPHHWGTKAISIRSKHPLTPILIWFVCSLDRLCGPLTDAQFMG